MHMFPNLVLQCNERNPPSAQLGIFKDRGSIHQKKGQKKFLQKLWPF